MSMWLGLAKRLLVDRNGQRLPLIRNYALQYAVAGSLFVLAGLVALGFGNVVGLGLIPFGLGGYLFAAAYYRLF